MPPNAKAHRERPHRIFSALAELNGAAMQWRVWLGVTCRILWSLPS